MGKREVSDMYLKFSRALISHQGTLRLKRMQMARGYRLGNMLTKCRQRFVPSKSLTLPVRLESRGLEIRLQMRLEEQREAKTRQAGGHAGREGGDRNNGARRRGWRGEEEKRGEQWAYTHDTHDFLTILSNWAEVCLAKMTR